MISKAELEDEVRIRFGVDVYAVSGKQSRKQIETARVLDTRSEERRVGKECY
jgi:hypothetical protein